MPDDSLTASTWFIDAGSAEVGSFVDRALDGVALDDPTAAARRAGISARLGFADVKNHLTTEKLSERMGTDVFYWHGYSELLLGDRWFKVSSAFNMELCDRFGVQVLDFDGTDDALMHPFDQTGRRHMEYVAERGSYDDPPLDEMLADFDVFYPGLVTSSGDDEPDAAFAATP
jgi:hypothetical protein